MRSPDAELDFENAIIDGITTHYARTLAEARAAGDQAAIAEVLRRIEANYLDSIAVGQRAVQIILSQSR